MEYSREKARKFSKDKNFLEARQIYSKLWSDNIQKSCIDKWLGWEYAKVLKNIGELDKSISICKAIYEADNEFKYNNDLLSWCLYEKYFKNLTYENINKNPSYFFRLAEFIIKITKQEDILPYENTIWKVVKLYKKPFKAEIVYKWLSKLDVDKLNNMSNIIKANDKDIELASPKEEWFYLMCKSLKELCRYDECIEMCDLAFLSISKFHNDRDVWMYVMKAESLLAIGLKEQAADLLNQLLIKKEHWVLYKTIFKVQVALGNDDEGLISAYSAALSRDPLKGKVNLLYDIGKILEKKKEFKYALMHYNLCKIIKMENSWNVQNELNNSIEKLSDIVNIESNNLLDELKDYWKKNKIKSSKRLAGIIFKILPPGKAGFIKTDDESYYFKKGSLLSTKVNLQEGTKVTFTLKDSFDSKKGKMTKEAVDILYV